MPYSYVYKMRALKIGTVATRTTLEKIIAEVSEKIAV